MIIAQAASVNFDPASFVREFGLSVTIILFMGWIVYSICKNAIPVVAAAYARRMDADTRRMEVQTDVIQKFPEVIDRSGKETREVIAAFKEAMMGSEGRIRDDLKTSLLALREDIFDDTKKSIDKNLYAIKRHSGIIVDPDTDPSPPLPKK